jgi:hypothetical protein
MPGGCRLLTSRSASANGLYVEGEIIATILNACPTSLEGGRGDFTLEVPGLRS